MWCNWCQLKAEVSRMLAKRHVSVAGRSPVQDEKNLLVQQLRRIEEINCKVAGQGRDVIAVGSFVALIDLSTDMTWLNYAVPIEPLGTKAEVAEVLLELREV